MTEHLLDVSDLVIPLPGGGDRRHGVDGISFTVAAGRTTCLIGESGSGKSLTAQAILGLLPEKFDRPTGTVEFEGANLLALEPSALRRVRGARIGMIFQEPMTALNPLQKVGRQIDEVLREHIRMTQAARRARILSILGEVNLDAERVIDRFPHQLSGGQRQRVMIAMALVMEPRLLIADEPTTALDVTTQAQILRLISQLQARHGTGVLFITHDFGVVRQIADDIAVMHRGRVVEAGPVSEILSAPRKDYTRALLAAVPKGDLRPAIARTGPVVLDAVGLTKVYHHRPFLFGQPKRFVALQDVSLQLRSGEILGIVGESGSGKSTTARCISRLVDADEGKVLLDGQDFGALRGDALRLARQRMQMVFQDPYSALNPRRRVGDILMQAPLNFGVPRVEAEERARRMLQLVGLDPSAFSRFPGAFSGGQRQRICIARALIPEPKLLIADEAVSALDVSVQAQILTLLRSIRDQMDLAILFITHDLRVAAELCDRLIVMKDGNIVDQGTCSEVLFESTVPYTRTLIDAIPGSRLTKVTQPVDTITAGLES
ncbi:ABC transporter ATP-binding protein [Rhizobium pusense]|uniref:ABC transporter ATP-binding protein n=1 Tax=Agrobacterium pusense TaxID=648995 RepID=UPI002449B99A|nr:ABC transporter ATP-binding protein [Agrobacterium pusense]MDH2091668.1 ABC transporter ATP-binding protein [Agrobacterium pusense]